VIYSYIYKVDRDPHLLHDAAEVSGAFDWVRLNYDQLRDVASFGSAPMFIEIFDWLTGVTVHWMGVKPG
jgi:hypothetical protein